MLASEQQIDHILVIEDKRGKRHMALETATYTIGRDSSNTIVLYSQLVSRQHATLLRVTQPETATYLFRLVDGNLQGKRSTNGLRVNGRRCFYHDLKHGDAIVFGNDVKARYYATAKLADVEFLTAGFADAAANVPPANSNNSAQSTVVVEREQESSTEAALIRLASFPELISHPILEVNLAGNITYLNPAAIAQFPDIRAVKLEHPLLAGLLSAVQTSQEKFFVREVEVNRQVFEQSVHYIAESDLVRTYVVDITERKQTEAALRESEAKNRALLDAMPDLILRISATGDYLDYIPAKDIEMLATGSELLGKNEYEVMPAAVAQQRMHHVQRALQTGETQIVEYQIPVNGSIREEEARIVVSGENEALAIIRDITERKQVEALLRQTHEKLELRVEQRTTQLSIINEQLRAEIAERQRAEKEVRFLQKIKQATSEAVDFHSALEVALRRVCSFTGWQYGEAWIPNADGSALECSIAWYGDSEKLANFHQSSQKWSFAPTVGLPGRVWASQYSEWIQNVEREPQSWFLRKHLAIAAEFKAGLGIPIIEGDRVLAVMTFFMFESCEENRRLVEIVSTAATQIGALIQRKRAEAALKDSEERFRLLIEGVKDYAIFMLDPEGHIVSWNSGAERIQGYQAAEIIGKHFSCFYSEADIAAGKPEQHLHLCREQGQFDAEGWQIRQDGSQLWANVALTALRDSDRKLCGFSIVMQDATKRQQAEEALRESEERLQAILDNSTALIYVKDTQGKYILVNNWYSTLFHLDQQEIKGKTDYDIFPSELADTYRANDQKVLAAGTALQSEEVVPQDDGLHTYISIKFPLYNTAGIPYAVCGISTDITGHKQAEEALRSSVATNRALLNAMPDLMFRINAEGIFVNLKAAKNAHLPLRPSEVVGKSLSEVLPPEVAQPMAESIQRALQTGDIQILEYQLPVERDCLDFETRIVVSAKNEVIAIVRDITERKRAEAEIRNALEKEKELSELKSRFVTIASHEFRTPLATILSSTELLEHYSHKWTEEKKLSHLQRIQVAVKHMTGLLNDVLLIGKAEAGKLDFKPAQINLAQFCQELVEEMELTASTHKIDFQVQAICSTTSMDEKLLRHILSNLLSNALKYSPQGGTVYFNLSCEPEKVIFRVQDEGIGIPEVDQVELFKSFHRASNVGNISGTGLGLAIVKKSVDLHGGEIAVESTVGVGTTFIVTLPLNQQG